MSLYDDPELYDARSQPEPFASYYHLRCIYPQELRLLLASEGFELENRWGGFSHQPFTSGGRLQACSARCAGRHR
jgi:hypothetical protein